MLRCIIIEDEPIAAEIMQDYISNIQQLKLKGSFTDAIYALDYLREHEVDLIFLDLHLPKINGFDFLKTLKNPPQVIVTTAYHQYALDGYQLNVIDYLLKPIEFSRLLQAVNKLNFHQTNKTSLKERSSEKQKAFRFFNVNKKKVKIWLEDIYYIESLKEYVKIHLKNDYLVTQYQIGEIEQELKTLDLIRIHRSFLVVQSKIEAYTSSTIEINGISLPIGRTYKSEVLELLKNYR